MCVSVCRDDVEWDEERKREAEEKVTQNSKQPVPDEDRKKFEDEAAGYWDSFYGQHQNRSITTMFHTYPPYYTHIHTFYLTVFNSWFEGFLKIATGFSPSFQS